MTLGFYRKVWLRLVLVALATTAVIVLPRLYRTALLGSGVTAQILCGGVFVSGRDPQSLLAEDLTGKGYELLSYFQHEVDRDGRRVSASAYGLARQTAIYRQGLGCTLLDGKSETELRSEDPTVFLSLAARNPEILWPEGEQVALGTLPDGVDGAALATAVESVFAEPDPAHPRRSRALVVVYDGRIVAERYAEGFNAAMPLIGWSMSKSAVNALVGLRVKDGKLALSDTALMPQWQGEDDSRRAITLDQLMRMTSGLAFDETYGGTQSDVVQMLFVKGDKAAFAADQPLVYPPGTHWAYSSGTTTILSAILRRSFANEHDYLGYPLERLFGPLGMRSAVLEPDASGTFAASSFLYASARDFARLGLLFMHDGVWEGTRLLPEGWVAYSRKPTVLSPRGEYGAHVWLKLPESARSGKLRMPTDAYYMLGHDQQILAVVPSRDLVIVRLGLTREDGDWDSTRELAPIVAAFPVPAQ
jgi:CubicO group peptidase (beta-lactamase class C family)